MRSALFVFLLFLCLAPLVWANDDTIRPTITETSRIVILYGDPQVNTVPEPGTLALLACAAGAAWLARKKK